MTDKDAGKKNAGHAAAALVEDGMTLGLGTGSTAAYFIEALAGKIQQGWRLAGVPTSKESERAAANIGIDIITPDETTQIALAVDGADEADPQLNLIKGGGGALFREKIVASAADRFVVIADAGKRVSALGAFALPVEIDPFGWALTIRELRECLTDAGFTSPSLQLRKGVDGAFLSDGGHLIADCALERIEEPAGLDAALRAIPGVIETGLFCGMADEIIYGDANGVVSEKPV